MYYLAADIIRYQQKKKTFPEAYNLSGRNDYPLLKPFEEF